jgi:hypothetical protein
MSSFFEIGGIIIDGMEFANQQQPQSALQRRAHTQANRETRQFLKGVEKSGVLAAPKSSQFRTADRTLTQQWKHTVFMPIRDFREAGINFNVPALLGLGIGSHLKAIQSNYHWFMGRLMPDYDQ